MNSLTKKNIETLEFTHKYFGNNIAVVEVEEIIMSPIAKLKRKLKPAAFRESVKRSHKARYAIAIKHEPNHDMMKLECELAVSRPFFRQLHPHLPPLDNNL